jgi:hypothetical protein
MGILHDSFTDQHRQFRKTGHQTRGQLLEAEVLLDPGARVPRHLHLRQDERMQALEDRTASSLAASTAGRPRATASRFLAAPCTICATSTRGPLGFCCRYVTGTLVQR